ncbi:uncharacterized protein LOC116403239 [Cucumis sativus]|uniref:uncharacterized protein LOC116403239 n=1 Tax=Cucumis sativus TaxID=3659 RepID=UPI0012F5239A|nr:uncharacterized protein LOC116403239 [Cucumis sativus]KAE8649718.1 hypothetical protein Csa_012480 [Cucumis sativus]
MFSHQRYCIMSVEEAYHTSKPIEDINDDLQVQSIIGQLAVEDHNKKTGDNLELVDVVNGLRSGIFVQPGSTHEGILYHLLVEAKTIEGINWTYVAKLLELYVGCRISCRPLFTVLCPATTSIIEPTSIRQR